MFGIPSKEVPRGEWKALELPDKNVKVEHCSCDNSGTFCLVISDKGVAYFAGLNRKGESGEIGNRGILEEDVPFTFFSPTSLFYSLTSLPPSFSSLLEPPSPARRQEQNTPMKLKRIGKVKDHHIVSGACGAHATCLISKDGKVFMFGNLDEDLLDKNTGTLQSGLHACYIINTCILCACACMLHVPCMLHAFILDLCQVL